MCMYIYTYVQAAAQTPPRELSVSVIDVLDKIKAKVRPQCQVDNRIILYSCYRHFT